MSTSHFRLFVTACGLLHSDREDLRGFIVSATGDGDSLSDLVTAVTFLTSARDFAQLVTFLQLDLELIDDIDSFKTETSDDADDTRLGHGFRCRVEGVDGFFAIATNGRCLMSADYYEHLADHFEQLKMEIENTYAAS